MRPTTSSRHEGILHECVRYGRLAKEGASGYIIRIMLVLSMFVFAILYSLCTCYYVYNILENFCFVATAVCPLRVRWISEGYLTFDCLQICCASLKRTREMATATKDVGVVTLV